MYVFPVDHPDTRVCSGIGKGHDAVKCTDRGKHPVVAFTEKATTKTPVIHAWWGGNTYNVGVNVGKSGLLVIDEDQPEAFAKYAADHGVEIPDTFAVKTGKGRHYYFKDTENGTLGNAEGALSEYGINVRSGNAYVVGPGSQHASGAIYTVESDHAVAPLPGWVVDAVKAKTNGHKADSDGWTWFGGGYDDPFELPDVISDGQRDSVLFKFACSLNAQGIRRRTAELLMREAFQRCEQPPTAGTAFTWDEALAKLEQAYRYESGRAEARGEQPAVARRAKITRASDIIIRPVVWAWAIDGFGRMPCGALTLAAGREGTGKSSFAILIAAQITRGILPGAYFGTPRKVFYLAVEDSWSHTIAPRLAAAGADLELVYRFEVVNDTDDEVMLSLPADNNLLEAEMIAHNVALVIIDPLMSVLSERIDTHRTREVRFALDPLAKLADRTRSVVLGVCHFNKSSGTDAASLLSGSHAFRDVPRSIFGFARDDDDNSRVMTQVKNSLGRDDLPSLSYTIETAYIDTAEGLAETGRFGFTGESERTVADILRDARHDSDDREEKRDAGSWIKAYLTQAGGMAPSRVVLEAGKAAGHKEQTLKNARRKVADTKPSGFGPELVHTWILRTGTGIDTADTTPGEVVPAVPKAVPVACTVCGFPLNEALAAAGETTHPTCEDAA